MFKKYLKLALCATLLGASAVACGGDDEKDGDNDSIIGPEPEPAPAPDEDELMSPAEAKDFLDKSAIEFMGKIRTSDHKDVITLTHFFTDEYGDLEAPDNFEVEPVEGSRTSKAAPARLMADLGAAVASYDVTGIANAIVTYTYTLGFKQFTGIYEPGTERWVKRGNSDDIIFRFSDEAGRNCELTVTGSSSTYDIDYSSTDEEYGDYVDPATGKPGWGYFDTETSYYVKVPKELTFRLTQSGAVLASGKVDTDINIAAHTVTANITAKIANVDITADINGTDTKVEERASFFISGEKVLTNVVVINGNDLCNKDRITGLAEQGEISDDDLMSLFTSANVTVDAMGKVQLVGAAEFDRSLFKAIRNIGSYWDSYDYDLKLEAENDVNDVVDALNDKARFVMRFNGNNTTQAKLSWKTDYDDWGDYWEYTIEPVMQFISDEMTYSFEEYFEVGFSDTDKQWNNLYNSYKKLWDSTGN